MLSMQLIQLQKANSESSSEKESSPSGESTPSDSSSPSEESESPSPEPVCEHPLMEETYVAPTKLSQGHTLHSCTTCEYSYKTDFPEPFGPAKIRNLFVLIILY